MTYDKKKQDSLSMVQYCNTDTGKYTVYTQSKLVPDHRWCLTMECQI